MNRTEGYCITASGERVILESSDNYIDISNMDIIELILPEGCERVFCDNNQLTELVIPKGCKKVYCDLTLADRYWEEWQHLDCDIRAIRRSRTSF